MRSSRCQCSRTKPRLTRTSCCKVLGHAYTTLHYNEFSGDVTSLDLKDQPLPPGRAEEGLPDERFGSFIPGGQVFRVENGTAFALICTGVVSRLRVDVSISTIESVQW